MTMFINPLSRAGSRLELKLSCPAATPAATSRTGISAFSDDPPRLRLLLRLLWALNNRRRGRRGGRSGELLAAFAIQVRAHPDVDGKALPGVTLVDATHGRHVTIISPIGQSN